MTLLITHRIDLAIGAIAVGGLLGWFVARRVEMTQMPELVAAIRGFVEAPTFSPDERALYYHRKDGDRFVLFRVAR